jgi:hypothetical protein
MRRKALPAALSEDNAFPVEVIQIRADVEDGHEKLTVLVHHNPPSKDQLHYVLHGNHFTAAALSRASITSSVAELALHNEKD